MKEFFKNHPIITSIILAILILYILTMLTPLALQGGERVMDLCIFIEFTVIVSILAIGQFKSAAIQRKNECKALMALNYFFGGVFLCCGILIIIAGVYDLMR